MIEAESFLKQSLPTLPIWEVRRIHGSILGFDIGAPVDDRPPSYLAIEFCDWFLSHNGKVVLDSIEWDDDIYEDILEELHGKRITCIEMMKEGHEIKITIDGGYHFVLRANLESYDPEDDLFFVNQQGKPSIGYRVDRGFSFEDQ